MLALPKRYWSTVQDYKAWVQKYLEGDREARLQMRTHTAGLTLPVGTLEQINAF
jgi:hypothetical protein